MLSASSACNAQTNWTGANSTDWFDGGNWSAGVPGIATAAVVDKTSPNSAVVSGAAAASDVLAIGVSGTGALNIQNGATVSSSSGRIAILVGGIGTVTVTGPGSTWTNSHELLLGSLGSGTLSIQNGGAVSNANSFVGAFTGSTGTATVSGPGSTWTNTADLNVGSFGSGTLNIQNGGAVSSANSSIGANAGATGTATVTGSGSTWTNTTDLVVGSSGTGTLNVQNGGAVSSATSSIGANAGATGTATVTGSGSTWTNTASMIIGSSGTGALNIQNGGAVSSSDGRIGILVGSVGTVTVTGSGSTWTNLHDLLIGSLGSGTLSIQDGGVVSNANGFVGAFAGPTGTVTVAGFGSTWINTANLNIGSFGGGALNIQSGGAVSDANGSIGALVGSTGTATVTGQGSTWTNTTNLRIGDSGTGTLSIQNGGTVSATSVDVARVAGSTGTLNMGAAAGAAAMAPGTLNTPMVTFGAGTGRIVFNHTATSYTFAPDISGQGTVQILSGTTNLAGTGTYTGGTIVDGGVLLVNGSIALSPLTTVNIGGTLGGAGTIGNTVINGGTLAPGNSIGTLAVQGNLALSAASTYMIEVSPTTSDRTDVAGTATLGGALVSVRPLGVANQRYTIVHATGGVVGTFGTVSVNNFNATLSYDSNNAYLTLDPALGFGTTLNRNQQAVASSINYAWRTGSVLPAGFQNLFSLAGTNLAGTLSQLSGEAAAGAQQAAFKAMDSFLGTMSAPFMRSIGGPQVGATGYLDPTTSHAFAREDGKASRRSTYANVEAAPRTVNPQRPWTTWTAAYGGSQTAEGNAVVGSQTNTSRVYGGAAGFDYRLSPDTWAGFALGGAGTSYNLANGLGGGRSEIFQAGAYGRHDLGAAHLAVALAYGWHDVTTDRTALFDSLRANFKASSISGRLEGGYRVASAMGGLTPYAAGQFTTFFLPDYAERPVVGVDTFALTYTGRAVSVPRMELGLQGDVSLATRSAIVTLRGRAAWAHNFSTDRIAAATFQTLPAASFVVSGAAEAREAALLSASAETRWANGFSVATTFEGEISRGTGNYTGKGVLRYQW